MKGKRSIHSYPLVIEEAPLGEGQGLTGVARLDAAGRNADPVGAPCSVPSSHSYIELRGRGAGSGVQAPGIPPAPPSRARPLRPPACLGARAPPARPPKVSQLISEPDGPRNGSRPRATQHPQGPKRSQFRHQVFGPEVGAGLAGKQHSAGAAESTRNYTLQKAVRPLIQ